MSPLGDRYWLGDRSAHFRACRAVVDLSPDYVPRTAPIVDLSPFDVSVPCLWWTCPRLWTGPRSSTRVVHGGEPFPYLMSPLGDRSVQIRTGNHFRAEPVGPSCAWLLGVTRTEDVGAGLRSRGLRGASPLGTGPRKRLQESFSPNVVPVLNIHRALLAAFTVYLRQAVSPTCPQR